MVAIATRTHQDLVNKANASSDPEEKARLLKSADELKASSMALIQAAKVCAQNPNEANKLKLKSAYKDLQDAIARARANEATPPGFEPLPVFEDNVAIKPHSFNDFDFVPDPNDAPLVRAAKEQARAALEILREAELSAGDDADLRRRIAEAGEEVKLWCKRVVDAARKAAANPNDAQAQADLAYAQQELSKAINKLVALTKGGADVREALSLLELSARDSQKEEFDALTAQINAFMKAADQALNEIKQNFGSGAKLTPQRLVETARGIAQTGRELSRLLKELANAVKEDEFKEQLINCSKILNDKGLQLKILAAVKASEGGDSGGQVKSAALGLGTQLEGVKDTVRALALRFRVRNTEKQTQILKQIAALVRKGRTKKY